MSNRITDKQLEAVVARLNTLTKSPESTYTQSADGKFTANIGNYHLDYAYGGVSLHRIVSPGGGITDVFGCGHVTKRDLINRMWAFLSGLEASNE